MPVCGRSPASGVADERSAEGAHQLKQGSQREETNDPADQIGTDAIAGPAPAALSGEEPPVKDRLCHQNRQLGDIGGFSQLSGTGASAADAGLGRDD